MERLNTRTNHCGLTLTELLISSILVGVIMVGAISSDFMIRGWQRRIENRALLQMDMSRAMQQIVRDGTAAQGDGNNICNAGSDPTCAIWYNEQADQETIIFRINPNLAIPSDEYWVSYETTTNADGSVSMKRDVVNWLNTVIKSDNNFLTNMTSPDFYTIHFDGSGNFDRVEIHITARPDAASAADPLNNPNYTLQTSFHPVSLSE